MTIPVVPGATGVVTGGFKGKFGAVPGKQSTDSLQKAAVPGMSPTIGQYCRLKLEA